jgi:hypothetical protein
MWIKAAFFRLYYIRNPNPRGHSGLRATQAGFLALLILSRLPAPVLHRDSDADQIRQNTDPEHASGPGSTVAGPLRICTGFPCTWYI